MSKSINKLLYIFSAIIVLFAIFYAVMTYQMKTNPITSQLLCEGRIHDYSGLLDKHNRSKYDYENYLSNILITHNSFDDNNLGEILEIRIEQISPEKTKFDKTHYVKCSDNLDKDIVYCNNINFQPHHISFNKQKKRLKFVVKQGVEVNALCNFTEMD